jgi:N-methylhydantoinase A/oxoprolinase/acetone carboxylase beta subunit
LPTAWEQRHHALAVLGLAGALEPWNVDRGAGRRRIAACALGQVGSVHSCAVDADQELALAGHGIRPLLGVECAFRDDSRPHSGMLRR